MGYVTGISTFIQTRIRLFWVGDWVRGLGTMGYSQKVHKRGYMKKEFHSHNRTTGIHCWANLTTEQLRNLRSHATFTRQLPPNSCKNVCMAVHTEPVNLGSSSKTLTTHKQHTYLRITREMWKHASITLSTRQINANSYIGKYLAKRNLSPLYQYLSLRFNKALKGLFISSKCLHNWPIFSP